MKKRVHKSLNEAHTTQYSKIIRKFRNSAILNFSTPTKVILTKSGNFIRKRN